MTRATLKEFIERAKAAGATDEAIVGMLGARGWAEKGVYEALAAHYETTLGVEVPARHGGAAAAKDAFFYLVIFATLGTWTVCLGSLCFSLIAMWIPDALFSPANYPGDQSYSIAGSIAGILVAFPIYLLVSRKVLGDARESPERLQSPVRKWLTYLALVIAAAVFIGDLIEALTHFLRGEITSRFLSEALVVLALSCGVLVYYFLGLRSGEETGGAVRKGWDARVAAGTSVVVAGVIFLGFLNLGGPGRQRELRADRRRVQDIGMLAQKISETWQRNNALPKSLEDLPGVAIDDPVSRRPYEYHVKENSEYELCATFSSPSEKTDNINAGAWTHPAGHFCYELNAVQPLTTPGFYEPD